MGLLFVPYASPLGQSTQKFINLIQYMTLCDRAHISTGHRDLTLLYAKRRH